jgi:hypothetical protein
MCQRKPTRPMATGRLCATLIAVAAAIATWSVVAGEQHIEVFKPDGSRQCERDTGTPPSRMRAELAAAGILVHSARSASDDMMHTQVCGAPTGRINVFVIDSAALDDARALGFLPFGDHR